MELGNFFFGNSRGEVPLERGKWQREFNRIFDLSKLDPYTEFENEVFKLFPYWWGDCTCGVQDLIDQFEEENTHLDTCVSREIDDFEKQLEEEGVQLFTDEFQSKIVEFLKSKGYKNREGYKLFCDCGFREKLDQFHEVNPHKSDCKLVIPNFLYKPTGYQIKWYKYPLRDSYADRRVQFKTFSKMVQACIESLGKKSNKRIRIQKLAWA